jgi:hypothetical protein
MKAIEFRVVGVPVGQPRAKSVPAFRRGDDRQGGDRFGMVHTVRKDHQVHRWKAAVQHAFLTETGRRRGGHVRPYFGTTLLVADAFFLLPRPAIIGAGDRVCWGGVYDLDNLIKSVWDALKGLAFRDDRQIVAGVAVKVAAASGEDPGVLVRLFPAPETPALLWSDAPAP